MYVLALPCHVLLSHPLWGPDIAAPGKLITSSCAAINGINRVIVDRANELVSLSARGENLIAACAVLSTEEMQALQDAV